MTNIYHHLIVFFLLERVAVYFQIGRSYIHTHSPADRNPILLIQIQTWLPGSTRNDVIIGVPFLG